MACISRDSPSSLQESLKSGHCWDYLPSIVQHTSTKSLIDCLRLMPAGTGLEDVCILIKMVIFHLIKITSKLPAMAQKKKKKTVYHKPMTYNNNNYTCIYNNIIIMIISKNAKSRCPPRRLFLGLLGRFLLSFVVCAAVVQVVKVVAVVMR